MLNVGVIGYGYWGPNLARNWNNNNRANLKYICDLKKDRLNIAKTKYPNIQTTTDYTDILEDPDIEAVNVVTPISTHYEITKNVLEHDKHALVEKPLTASSEQLEELIELAEKKNKVLMVGHTFLYSPPVLKVKEYIKNGELGDMDFIQLSRINLGRVKHDYNVVWDLSPHDFSILEFWLQELPETIQVVGKASTLKNVCDVAFVNLKFPNNILVNVNLSWVSPVKVRQSYVVGDEKMVIYDDVNPNAKVKLYDMGIDKIKKPETFGEFQLSYRTGDILIPQLDNTEPLYAECDHFIDCIRNDADPRTNPQHALRIVKMIEAAQESLKKGGEVIEV